VGGDFGSMQQVQTGRALVSCNTTLLSRNHHNENGLENL
jgi:hypothetical protein